MVQHGSLGAERETDRLILRPWSEDYFDEFAAVCSDSEAMRFISGGRPLSTVAVREITGRTCRMWSDYGFGPWAAIERTTGRWVGRVGLNLLEDWEGPHKWEIGFELARDFWGRGLATEGAREAVRFGFEDAGLERVISVTRPDHAASRRVMEKCGLVLQAEIDWRTTRIVWYALDRHEYEANQL